MRLANRALLFTLLILTLIVSVSAQTLRSDRDPRNTAPTVGTGGPPGGPTGLFTVYDGQTLRKGEYTFSVAYSNFDRDPGDVDITEVPVSFQVGVNDYIELFFNTDAYRAVKVNAPRNLSSFYLPNSQLFIGGGLTSGPAVILGTGFPASLGNGAVFRPQGTQPIVSYPFVGGSAGLFGAIGLPNGGQNGAASFPGLGSPCGSILPGIVLQTAAIRNAAGAVIGNVPTSGTVCPTYLPDAPFVNRTYGESSFSTFTVGGKLRFTGPNNPVGIGLIPFYRFYADKADDFDGFNQLTRGSSPGGNNGDFGLVLFADARLRKWINVSANLGYIYNSDVKFEDITLLDRPDEVIAAFGVDFPVNKYFQPILEFRSLQYVGGRTPNAFENSPLDGLAGLRVFPTRYLGFGVAYRHHFNSQDRDSFDTDDQQFTTSVTIPGATPIITTVSGIPGGFQTSVDPHGFIIQGFIGRRNARQAEIINQPANVTGVALGEGTIYLPCPAGSRSRSGQCSDDMTTTVATTATDPENDVLTYNYTVSGGRIVGTGANVTWDLSGARPGSYTITAGVDDGCGICGQTQTQTVTIAECTDCEVLCTCPTISVDGPPDTVQPGERMTFTANVSGGSQDSVTYSWTVDQGTIVEGQGTPSITVDTTGLSNTTVRATVTVGNLCADCRDNEASDTGVVAGIPVGVQIDEFGKLANDDVRARIDNLFIELQNDPGATGYIINYGPAREVTARERLIRNHIAFRNYDASRVVIINGGVEPGIRTTVWRVPQGAEPPTP